MYLHQAIVNKDLSAPNVGFSNSEAHCVKYFNKWKDQTGYAYLSESIGINANFYNLYFLTSHSTVNFNYYIFLFEEVFYFEFAEIMDPKYKRFRKTLCAIKHTKCSAEST